MEKELTAWWKSRIHTQFPLWLQSSVVRACDKNSQDPRFDSRRGCAVFFPLIRLSILLSLSEMKEKRIWLEMIPTRASLWCSLFFRENWSQERITGNRPNLAQLLTNALFPKRCYWFLKFGFLPIFLLPFPKETLYFANTKRLEPYPGILKKKQKFKIPSTVL